MVVGKRRTDFWVKATFVGHENRSLVDVLINDWTQGFGGYVRYMK